jgi:hypothetical protein
MRKSTVIAQCLINSDMIRSLEQAELSVRRVFDDEFADRDFDQWNTNVNDDYGSQVISDVGKAMTINVKRFIEDLS